MADHDTSIDDNDDELYEHYSFTAEKGQQPLRIDKYLMNFVENATRNKIQQAAKDGCIFVNGTTVKSNYKVKPNDQITVKFEHPPHENLLVAEDIPIDIVWLNRNHNYSSTHLKAEIYNSVKYRKDRELRFD